MIDFTTLLVDLDGQPIKETDANGRPTGPDLTLGRAVRTALLLSFPDEPLSAEGKVARYMLAGKATGRGVTLTAEETVTMKAAVGKGYGPLVVGRSWELLDPPSVPKGNGQAPVTRPAKATPNHAS